MTNGASFQGKVTDDKAKRSPLVQGGLDLPIKMKVTWNNIRMLNILKEHITAVRYPLDEYKDETKEILKDIFETYNIVNEKFGANDDEEAESEEM